MYLYEMHQHTAPCSGCSRANPVKLVSALKKAGFSGVVITNHFLHGNTGIDRNLPRSDFIKAYEDDYLLAKKAGEAIGIDVIFGIEEGVGGGKEVLLYGITPEFLYSHPEIMNGELETIYNAVHRFGGLVFQAHPYRNRPYIEEPDKNLPLEFIDGFETYNACNNEDENIRAHEYAIKNGKLETAGSDAHSEKFENRFGIAVNHRIKTAEDLVKALKSGDYELYKNETEGLECK